MDELEAMLGKPDWKPPEEKLEIPKSISTPPDALVFVSLTTTCRCGEKFVTPNKKIMLRFKENFSWDKNRRCGKAEYNDLLREVKEVVSEVLACEKMLW